MELVSGPRLLGGALVVTLVATSACSSNPDPNVPDTVETAPPSTTSPAPAPTTASTTTSPLGDGLRRVAIVGDSVTVGSTEALRNHIAGTVQIAARRGARTTDMVAGADRLAAERPDVLVVNLGTNDEGCATVGGCPDGYRPEADDVAAGLARIVEPFDDACRLGVTIAYNLEQPPMVNPALDQMLAAGTIDGIVDWSTHRRDHEPDDEQWLVDLAGHVTPAGADALARLIAERIDEVCGDAI